MKSNMTKQKVLWCCHGNLQQPTVWNNLTQALQTRVPTLEIRQVNLWETLEDSCWSWAEKFCHIVQSVAFEYGDSLHYLLGYSLGGRLAMHSLSEMPELWSKALIVSADIGLSNNLQKEHYLQRDRTWANRFLTEPWQSLLTEWDALPVFCGRPCSTQRPESAFDRQKIAHVFEAYSKGHMDNLTQRLSTLSVPITYVTGSDDHRYCQLGQILQTRCATLTHVQIQDAGHRVPWEKPGAFLQILRNTLAL